MRDDAMRHVQYDLGSNMFCVAIVTVGCVPHWLGRIRVHRVDDWRSGLTGAGQVSAMEWGNPWCYTKFDGQMPGQFLHEVPPASETGFLFAITASHQAHEGHWHTLSL